MLNIINYKIKDSILKLKIIFGLIYFKYNQESFEWCFKLFGIPLLKNIVRYKKGNFYETILLLFLPIYKHNIIYKFQNRYIKLIYERYPGHDYYFTFDSGLGEIFLTLLYFDKIIKKYNPKNPLIIFKSKKLNDIYRLFNYRWKSIVDIEYNWFLNFENKYKDSTFIALLPTTYFNKTEKNMQKSKIHYYESLIKHLNIKNNITKPLLKIHNEPIIENITKHILNDNFVIIMPNAITIDNLPQDFWLKLCKKLKNSGFNIFLNITSMEEYIEGTFAIFLTIPELAQLAKYSKAIIGLRSGALEVISMLSDTKSEIIYNDATHIQNPMNAKNMMCSFSIKKLPFINTNKINEYIYNSSKEDELINDIINSIAQK